ncbi:MAG: histidine kinase dimerization/phospho-acceptor domain-containing protein [Vicinamibacterales bacterium]
MEAIGQLASGVAHEFNNLLTAIVGHAHFASEGVTDPAGQANLAEVITAANRASTLTRQLLAFSRQQVLEMAPLDLNEVVRDMATLLRPLLGKTSNWTRSTRPTTP